MREKRRRGRTPPMIECKRPVGVVSGGEWAMAGDEWALAGGATTTTDARAGSGSVGADIYFLREIRGDRREVAVLMTRPEQLVKDVDGWGSGRRRWTAIFDKTRGFSP